MEFLYKKLDNLREFGSIRNVPKYVLDNLNPSFALRPYQINAFENFITWYESNKRPYPLQNLFHMATGSGKTLIMAGLIIYLYKKGYRNFLFFVNLTTIVQKTKDNFLNNMSSKYLFADEINIDGEKVVLKEVSNFQYSDSNAINICFTTTQGIHSDIWFAKENSMTIDDFANHKVVLISDESHHLNADTKKKMSKDDEEAYHSWEYTVRHIFNASRDNILLEFTATCNLANPLVRSEYENKIIFDYPLYKFRADKYSKEIKTLRTDVSIMERALQAVILSQYRLKIFQDNRLNIKPVVLFKAAKVKDSEVFMKDFIAIMEKLNGAEIERITHLTTNETLQRAYRYFYDKGISFDQLAQELREDFSSIHCISANDQNEVELKQIALNSLEDTDNPYRAIFEVRKLDEGWDVLNLFDIVRLYETRQSGGKKISPSTISEAQLVGRGARYCPFQLDEEQAKYQRKYDSDIDNSLRICEELYYHCQNDSRYIGELNNALREIGLDLEKVVTRDYVLKDSFRQDSLYRNGLVFVNGRVTKSRNTVTGILSSVRDEPYPVSFASGSSVEDVLLDAKELEERKINTYQYNCTIAEIAKINYAIVNKALSKYNIFKFNILRSYYPNLKSNNEFILSKEYLGDVKIKITSTYEEPPIELLYIACVKVLGKIAGHVSSIEETFEGTKEFYPQRISEVFKNKRCNYTITPDGGVGVSQNDYSVPTEYKIDLQKEEWFAFEDNFGTTEEKRFVAYFKSYVDRLKERYDKVYLIRNERQLHIYSFDGGERFEPDYILFLHSAKSEGYEQLQVFIEPKGTHLVDKDKWKEDFLLKLKENSISVKKFVDDNKYLIWGFHFFNHEIGTAEFDNDFKMLTDKN